jgi:site-specific recombinase XerD
MRPRKPERSGRHSPQRKQIEVRALRLRGIARELRRGDLRHSRASLLLAEGVHPRVVIETLGHSQISLTLDTYSVTWFDSVLIRFSLKYQLTPANNAERD